MADAVDLGKRDKWGEWHPPELLQPPPVFVWPPRPGKFLKWVFGVPGFLWPWNTVYAAIAILTYLFLTPSLATMQTFAPGWIAFIFGRNLVILTLVISAWHLRLYVQRAQGTDYKYNSRWLAENNDTFLFGSQLWDNVFWTVFSAVPVWTAIEVVTLWGQANGYFPYLDFYQHPVWFILMMLAIPVFRELHFYSVHRLSHWPPLYRMVHSLHHKNANPGPWSGMAMHPVEHVLYFCGVLIHWIIPSHPIHVIFHLQHLAFSPAQGHSGFDQVVVNGKAFDVDNYMHYLHHRYFEVNYGGDALVPIDKWMGTYHDGSPEAEKQMNERMRARRKRD